VTARPAHSCERARFESSRRTPFRPADVVPFARAPRADRDAPRRRPRGSRKRGTSAPQADRAKAATRPGMLVSHKSRRFSRRSPDATQQVGARRHPRVGRTGRRRGRWNLCRPVWTAASEGCGGRSGRRPCSRTGTCRRASDRRAERRGSSMGNCRDERATGTRSRVFPLLTGRDPRTGAAPIVNRREATRGSARQRPGNHRGARRRGSTGNWRDALASVPFNVRRARRVKCPSVLQS
jgi:hypothetical protein